MSVTQAEPRTIELDAARQFDWSYARSDDGGETWTPLWEIGYSRVL